jgi:hypothetical protein
MRSSNQCFVNNIAELKVMAFNRGVEMQLGVLISHIVLLPIIFMRKLNIEIVKCLSVNL